MSSILSIRGVTKHYRDVVAVDNVSFDVPEGALFGLLGPNGAGKTSLIRIITTITMADSGEIVFDGETLNTSHPEKIGYMPEERGLYRKMKVGEHLLYLAQLKGMQTTDARKKLHAMMEKLEITSWWNKKVEELSKGMQQKIQFISTILHEPRLIILDEPFSGLDPINANLIRDAIFELHRNGTTVIFSTHRMETVEQLCEYLVLINKGKNVLQGKVTEIRNSHKEGIFHVTSEGLGEGNLDGLEILSQSPVDFTFRGKSGLTPNELLRDLIHRGIPINGFEEVKPTLNDIFIKTVKSLGDA